jgi:hypothetical protein
MALTQEQEATNYHTMLHIKMVQTILHGIIGELMDRANKHDQSKLESPEVEAFTEFTPKLAAAKFPSEEYDNYRKCMNLALEHHYAKNRHHPEHFKNGIEDMNLIDVLEMFVDWRASSMRQNDGNLRKSLEHNAKRFGMSQQLTRILENTIGLLEDIS